MLYGRVSQSMAIDLNGPADPKPLHQSELMSTQLITFGGTSQGQKLNISRSKVAWPAKLVTAPGKNGLADFDHLYVERRSFVQGGAFWGS
jgi:hypothetical protein